MNKKTVAILLALSLMLFAGCGQTESEAVEITLANGQTLLTGEISELFGNELTLALVSETEAQSDNSGGSAGDSFPSGGSASGSFPSGSLPDASALPENSGASNGAQSGGGFPAGDSSGFPAGDSSGFPAGDSSGFPAGDSSGFPAGDSSGFPAGASSGAEAGASGGGSASKGSSNASASRVTYTPTGETRTLTIPVGTVVTTSLGAKTTFSRLAAGDVIKCVMQADESGEEIIVAVYIVG